VARRSRSGFTLVEIVIAFIIIGILTAVMVPTMIKRSDDAKITATRDDLRRLADAEERCSVDIGYVVRLYALDDGSRFDKIANTAANNQVTGLADEDNTYAGQGIYTTPEDMFISPSTQNFLDNTNLQQENLFKRLTQGMIDITAGATTTGSGYNPVSVVSWHGPYLNWTRDVNKNNWPDDVWGNDYLFFSANGVLVPPRVNQKLFPNASGDDITDYSNAFQPSCMFAGTTYSNLDKIFDRFTILSLGPNGLPGDGTGPSSTTGQNKFGQGDDIYISFGN
jgi:type II secretory pathway pseudopilin PulG